MLQHAVADELQAPYHTPFHAQLFARALELTDMSRSHMRSFYQHWDEQHAAYRAYRLLDKDDIKAMKEGRPVKRAVPAAYAKVQSFKTFVLAALFQKPRFYELESTGAEDEDVKELTEVLMENEVRVNNFYNIVGRWATHLGKYGVGILRNTWVEEYQYIHEKVTTPTLSVLGTEVGQTEALNVKKIPSAIGNRVCNVIPYHFLPDVRVGLHEIHKGEFCAWEFELSRVELHKLQHEGVVTGINSLPPLSLERAYARKQWGATHKSMIDYNNPVRTDALVKITEIEINITPRNFLLSSGEPLGTEDFPVKYLMWIANDCRIVRLEPSGYLHGKFNFEVAQFDEDDHEFLNLSLVDVVQNLQNLSDWFMSSRVENVSQNIEHQYIVDPVGVDVESIKNKNRVITLKKGAARLGIDKHFKQVDTRDVTANHISDQSYIAQIINSVSGVNENAQGTYASGRRSATEARVVNQSGSGRLRTIVRIAWGASFGPLGVKMRKNLRQGMTYEWAVQYAGTQITEEVFAQFQGTMEDIVRDSDFWVFDGTLDSEKQYTAQQLMELFQTVVTLGPQGIVDMELSPKLLLNKIYELLGVPNTQAFNIMKDPKTLQNAVQQIAMQMAQQMVEQALQQQSAQQPSGTQ
jgi:hypothetical protein